MSRRRWTSPPPRTRSANTYAGYADATTARRACAAGGAVWQFAAFIVPVLLLDPQRPDLERWSAPEVVEQRRIDAGRAAACTEASMPEVSVLQALTMEQALLTGELTDGQRVALQALLASFDQQTELIGARS